MRRLMDLLRPAHSRRDQSPRGPLARSPSPDPPTLADDAYPLGPRIAQPNPDHPSADGGTTCGADGSSGRLLYQSCDENGKPMHPSLVLAEPDGTVRARIDIPDPALVCPTRSGCRAVVRTGSGTTFVVDGANGTALELDLGDRANGLDYQARAGGGRWGFLSSPPPSLAGSPVSNTEKSTRGRRQQPHSLSRSALVDFATGAVTDLRDVFTAEFSTNGETLAVVTRPESGEALRVWLIPASSPRELRTLAVGDDFPDFLEFDAERLLCREYGDNWEQLVVVDVADGAQSAIAQAYRRRNNRATLDGRLLPGRPAVAVLFPDRFAVIDISDGTPRELMSVDGNFVTVFLPASGTGAVLHPSGESADRAPTFVDLERGTSRRLVSETGEPLGVLEWGTDDRWLLVSFGGGGYRSSALGIMDVETGTMAPLPVGNTFSRVSHDGRTLLLDLHGKGGRHCTALDLERGTVTEFDGKCPEVAVLSPDGKWIAYSRPVTIHGAKQWLLSVVETATGNSIFAGPGKDPVWLTP